MDPKVLQAQQWVNATYRGVTGYQACTEDGKTGWTTMYSLTRGLQHELGIGSLSDAFGPGTLAALASRGGVKTSETNQNIVKIVQSACYCKGYEPGGITGVFDQYTQSGISHLMLDAGLGNSFVGVITPKVMKALLTMDAYVVVMGGTEGIRQVQQWLNARYSPRKNFFIIPCDGHFSRDVQKALLLAIQFEVGLSDDQATGVFGPATQSGLRSHPLASGSTGAFVRLFSAALVFNGYGFFTDTFDSALSAAVKTFQKFTLLTASGSGDYPTWAELLVSTGDPSRSGTAADCITTITTARAKALYTVGYRAVGRYLDERAPVTLNKQIQPGELATIFANGLKVFPISQYYGGERGYFTYSQGYTDALAAHAAAVRLGFAAGTTIYFAVDYDATQADIDDYVISYFYGVVGGLASQGKRYLHGVYGSRNVCQQVTERTYARWSFVSGMSTGFSGNMGFPLPSNWVFNQIQTRTEGTGSGAVEIDKDVYRPGTDPAVSVVNQKSSAVAAFIAYVGTLYDLAKKYGKGDPNLLVLEFLRSDTYDNLLWDQLVGTVDDGYVDYVGQAGVVRLKELVDPFYGVTLRVPHFAASCNGVYLQGKPASTALPVNGGDVAGWAGDLMTFYGEWRRDSASYKSGHAYCDAKLAKVDVESTFKMVDLIEDADAYNVAMAMRAGTNVVDAVRANLTTGYLSRFKRYYQGRFGGLASGAAGVAKTALMADLGTVIDGGREYLCRTTGGAAVLMPTVCPSSLIDPFCQGFGDMLASRVGQENAKVERLRAQGKL